jgi:heptosyltransferase III
MTASLRYHLKLMLRRNVLLFHSAALGDFVLSWPVAMMFGRTMAQSRVIYVAPSEKGRLAERAIGVESRDAELFSPLHTRPDSLSEPARKLIAGATHVVSFGVADQTDWVANVRSINDSARLIPLRARPDDDWNRHLMMFHAEQLKDQPALYAPLLQMIEHVARSGAVANRARKATTVIHVGSGGADKVWPLDRFVRLAAELKRAGHDLVFPLGEVELERMPDAARALTPHGSVIKPADLSALFDLVSTARLYVGNDSGPTHLAAMCGTPVVALFGRDNEATWRPVGPVVTVLRHKPIGELDVGRVLSACNDVADRVSTAPPTPDDD